MSVIYQIIAFPFLVLIKIYQYIISPIFPATCRFQPTCSSYMLEAIQKRGPFIGVFLGVKRILKCHPYHEGGYDPVPSKKNKK
jgi:uncharacterized protein